MRKIMIVGCGSIFFFSCIGLAADNKPGQDGWMRLFNGQSLNGWRASENKESFRVWDGMIIAHGKRSHLFYEGPVENNDFTNFEFKADVMTFPGANSGIYFHTAYRESGWPSQGYEVQINNSFLGAGNYRELKKTGSLYGVRNLFASGVQDNEWFTMHIKVQGKRIQIKVNGRLLVDYIEPVDIGRTGRKLAHGTFALQGHDPQSEVHFKNIYVKPLPASSIKNIQSPTEIEFQKRITKYHNASIPLIDYHVHLKGGLTIEEALEKSRHAGITYGIAVNCGLGFPVHTDADAEAFFQSLQGLPVFKGMQAEGREWLTLFSKKTIAQFDYVFTDSMTFTDRQGRRTRLWMPNEVHIDDPQDFMDMLVEKTVGILNEEPIDIYVNPTFLPAVIAKDYDALWTPERMDKVIQAAVKNNVAIEINARYKLPSVTFIKRAQQAGAKFTFGTNNGNKDLGWCEYCLDVVDECNLKKKDIFIPRTGKKKIESWNPPKNQRDATWMKNAKFGVFVHFLGGGPDWNRKVNSFNVDKFADQIARTKAGYVILTLGQNSGFYCSPNAAYEKFAGYRIGERCSKRDLPMELADALAKRGIRLMLYLPSRSPQQDKKAMAGLNDVHEYQPAPQEFTRKWSAVIREWSLRYGRKISGWWFDGSYNTLGWDDLSKPNNWKTWADACRAGNPNSLLAFNPGTRLDKAFSALTDQQDYTAGEQNTFIVTPRSHPAPSGMQWHLLAHLGSRWARADGPQKSDDYMIAYLRQVNAQNGVVTLEVNVADDGTVYEPHWKQLIAVGNAIKN